MDLAPALAAHKERADKDKDAIMTMVGVCMHRSVFLHLIEQICMWIILPP